MKWTKLLGFLGLMLLPVALWASLASAQSFRTGDNTSIAANEVVDSTLFAAGRSIDIAGTVHGDVFCAGQTLTVSGTVHGDVICAGQTVNVSGTVMGDVRVAGQTVTVSADIKGNLSAGAQSFSLAGDGKVAGDASVGASDLTLNGSVGRDAAVGGTTVTLAHTVGRNVTANAEDLTLREQARVGGKLTYTSTNEAKISRGAQIVGATVWNKQMPKKENKANYGRVFAFSLGVAIFVILTLLTVSLVLVLVFPAAFHLSAKRALSEPLKTFLTGLLASFAAPVLIVGLMMTLIGLPLGLILLLAWLLVMALSGPFFSYFLGRIIMRRQYNPVLIMVIGSLAVLVSFLIPVLGAVVFLAVMWFGTGIILRELYFRTPKPTYDFRTKPSK